MKNSFIVLILIFVFSICLFAQDVSVVLKNSKVVFGRMIEEKPDYILLDNDLGQIKIDRQSIESINFNPFYRISGSEKSEGKSSSNIDSLTAYKFAIKDPVVVYLRKGNVVSGLLIAKSLYMIMVQTESGTLTIPKSDLSKIEYISSEYAERGEIVNVYLNNGQSFEGNIYFENSDDLTIDTELGRLTIPKNKLRTIEYTGKTGASKTTIADQYANITINQRIIQPRYDIISLGYTTKFGTSFGPGFGLGYLSRFNISQLQGLNISAVVGLTLNYFALNSDNITAQNPLLNANYKGGAFISTIGVGGQINVYPQTASFYEIFLTPMLEGHIIYKKLEQNFPSFPQFNTKETSTEFKLGIGVRFGVEFLFDNFRLGLQYNLHSIFGTDGFNQISLTFVKPLF